MPSGISALVSGPWQLVIGPILVLLLLGAWVGWGSILSRVIQPRSAAGGFSDPGLLGALGLAWSAVIGGVYNLLEIISPLLAWAHLGIGCIGLAFWTRIRSKTVRKTRRFRVLTVTFLVVLGSLLLVSAGDSAWVDFNPHDDHHAYLTFPVKMLESGALGEDPFSQRRLQSGLGGQYFLLSLALAGGGVRHVAVLDRAAALCLFLLIALGHWRRLGTAGVWFALVASFVVIVQIPHVNLSSLMTGSALLFALVSVLAQEPQEHPRAFVPSVALLASGLACLKTTWVPVAGIVVLLLAIDPRRGRLRERARWIALIGTVCFLLLIPWMVAQYRATGTFLYPFLGPGYDASALSGFASTLGFARAFELASTAIVEAESLACLALVLGLGVVARTDLAARRAALTVGALWASGLLLIILSDGSGSGRHGFPVWFTATAFGALELSARANKITGLSRHALLGVAALSLLLPTLLDAQARVEKTRRQLSFFWRAASRAPAHTLDFIGEPYLELEAALPESGPILTHVSWPALLDHSRHQFYIVDWPCGASPPPGMSCVDADAAAEYLCSIGVRHVVYDYARQASFSDRLAQSRLSHENAFFRATAERMLAFHRVLLKWPRQGHKVTFANPETMMLELSCGPR